MNSSQLDFRKRVNTERKSSSFFFIRRTSAYDSVFEQHLNDHDIYKNNCAQRSSNWAQINKRLAQSRSSLFFSQFIEIVFEIFQQINEDALIENKVMSKMFLIIVDTVDIFSQENLWFTNLKDLINDFIIKTQSDFYDKTRSEELNKQIREDLESYIVPLTNAVALCLLNFFIENKDFKELTDVCKNQAMYDEALDVWRIHELWSYIDSKTTFDNNAYTIASTYHSSELLIMYTTHSVKSTNSKNSIEYCMTQLNFYAMTENSDSFRQEADAWRNDRKYMNANRKTFIAAANAKALNAKISELDLFTQSLILFSSNESILSKSKTSADELALNLNVFHSFNHTTSIQAWTKASLKRSSNERLKKISQIKKKSDMNSKLWEDSKSTERQRRQ